MNSDEVFMTRAFELASKGLGYVRPNPLVGCVIVKGGKIIGEGFHQNYGEAHAEVNAVNSVEREEDLVGSTVYVTLEPCVHYGRTPPCADLLIRKQVEKVVIANTDPFPKVSGRGVSRLRAAGIQVEVGLLSDKGLEMNRRFFMFHNHKRPFVILKWAQTSDQFIARENFDSKWISNEYSRQMVHMWRAEEHAIMIGTNTASYDNPSLTTRDIEGLNPTRIVIDKKGRLSRELNVLDGSVPTICLTGKRFESSSNLEFDELSVFEPTSILNSLYKRSIQSVIIEGGSTFLTSFIEDGLWDEARVFESKKTFGKGVKAPTLKGELIDQEDVFGDTLRRYKNDTWQKN